MNQIASEQKRHSAGQRLDAVKIPPREFGSAPNETAYYVVRTIGRGDKRASKRRRTRLHSGKILASHGPVLTDCQIYDRSQTGARLRLFANVSVSSKIWLFDEVAEKLTGARVVWRRDREIGISFVNCPGPRQLTRAELARLRSGYNPEGH